MVEPQVTLEPQSLSPVEEKLRGPLEDQLTSALQAATDKIRSRYAGETVDEVTTELMTETKAGLHHDIADGWVPDQSQLRQLAEALIRDA